MARVAEQFATMPEHYLYGFDEPNSRMKHATLPEGRIRQLNAPPLIVPPQVKKAAYKRRQPSERAQRRGRIRRIKRAVLFTYYWQIIVSELAIGAVALILR